MGEDVGPVVEHPPDEIVVRIGRDLAGRPIADDQQQHVAVALVEEVVAVRRPGREPGAGAGRHPLPSGIGDVMKRFKKVITVESNWSDSLDEELIDEENRRYSALAILLRSKYLVDVDCWTEVRSRPIKPGVVRAALSAALEKLS